MTPLSDDIAVYEAMRADLESEHLGKWVVIHDRQLVGIFDDFDTGAAEAVSKFGRGPYLIRQIGATAVRMPASVMYRPLYEVDPLRI